MATLLPLLLLLLLLLLFPFPSHSQSSLSNIQSLLEFKKGIHSDPSGLLGSWSHSPAAAATPGGCPLSFSGVSCDDAGNVIGLELPGLGLAGELKLSTLSGLHSLRRLSLASNSLAGRLPPALGSLTSLSHLDLSNNKFYGPVPGRIFELSGLVHLNLSFNSLSGGFPIGLRNLQQLKFLDLRSNALWGDASVLLSELQSAEHVDLSGNGLYGGLPMDVDNVLGFASNVKYLNLSYNMIGGGFFSKDSVQLFKNLEVLDVGWNQISGELPSIEALTNLRVFRAASNQLYGGVPDALLGSRIPLVELDLSGNGFSGYIQDINSTTLKVLNLSSNALSGSLPSNLGGCVSVDFSNNMITGDLSVMKNWQGTLEVIDFSSNALSGNFPNETSQLGNVRSINMRNNSLVGVLPSVFGDYSKLSVVDLSLNKFTGPISGHLLASLTLTSLNLSGNHFTGSLPLQSPHSTETLFLPSYTHLASLDLSDNSLSGLLPSEIRNMERLKLLNLGKNSLSGELPSEIGKLHELEYVDLSNNHFKGGIPDMPQTGLKVLNVTYNNLSGTVPKSLRRFSTASFFPGNALLFFSDAMPSGRENPGVTNSRHRTAKSSIRTAVVVGSVCAVMLFIFAFLAFYVIRSQEFCASTGFIGQDTGRDASVGEFCCRNVKPPKDDSIPTTMGFSNGHLLTSAARSLSAQKELLTETIRYGYSDSTEGGSESMKIDEPEHDPSTTEWKPSPGPPLSSPHFTDSRLSEQPVLLDVYSPDRLAGELFLLDSSLAFTAEELSRAPAEVLGRSSHGTSYKATLNSGHMLTVKWLQVGLVNHKKEFAREAKRIGTIRHPNIISWRGYYWGLSEQERLIITDYVVGDSLALYLHESTPRRYSQLSVSQRLKIAIDVTRALYHLHHDRGLAHGNLKPTNVVLNRPGLTARLTDCGLHRLMTPSGTAEQLLNLGALGYRAPELTETSKPMPSFKADVYAFGVILMEMLTRRSAGDIISGQSGAVDLADWVQMCAREGRATDCFDRDITGLEEAPRVMDELLAVSLRCILPVNDRPNIRTVFEDLSSITM